MKQITSFSSFTTATFLGFNIVHSLYSYGIFWKQSDPHKYRWKRILIAQTRSAPPHPSFCNTTQRPWIILIFFVLVQNNTSALQTEMCVRNGTLVRPWPEWPERFHLPWLVNTKQTKDRQQPNYTKACTQSKFSGQRCFVLLFLSASQSKKSEKSTRTLLVQWVLDYPNPDYQYQNIWTSAHVAMFSVPARKQLVVVLEYCYRKM